ncbi:hypothetical protein BD289DRAFT_447155 [Coniella lustricola]|uniref:Secreted protein n=1 Tax=Coniella lustricola TaxID=2025994 RepID=A0A2T2ZTB6_9PEZI|nr:hypothetical protein BD289DRAFT_447155 [Coniella lustricola]
MCGLEAGPRLCLSLSLSLFLHWKAVLMGPHQSWQTWKRPSLTTVVTFPRPIDGLHPGHLAAQHCFFFLSGRVSFFFFPRACKRHLGPLGWDHSQTQPEKKAKRFTSLIRPVQTKTRCHAVSTAPNSEMPSQAGVAVALMRNNVRGRRFLG